MNLTNNGLTLRNVSFRNARNASGSKIAPRKKRVTYAPSKIIAAQTILDLGYATREQFGSPSFSGRKLFGQADEPPDKFAAAGAFAALRCW